MKKLLLILCVFLGVTSHALSYTIKGEVRDAQTNQPVEFAGIYIDGTTIGTITGMDGKFELTFEDNYKQIVISHISYDNEVQDIDVNTDTYLTILLVPKQVDIAQITIESINMKAIHMDYFKKVFLGVDRWGKKAEILNDSVLYFDVEYTEKSFIPGKGPYNHFIARASEPLKVALPDLGYVLTYDLVDFTEKYNPQLERNSIQLLGYSFFTEEKAKSKSQQKRFYKNRQKAYYNSTVHFMRSLYSGTLGQNGYRVYQRVNDTTSNKVQFEPFDLGTCNCIVYMEHEAWLNGLKGNTYVILYYYTGLKPRDLMFKKIDPKDERVKVSGCYYLKDICVVREDGSLPGGEIIFDGDMVNKRIGAALPYDIKF